MTGLKYISKNWDIKWDTFCSHGRHLHLYLTLLKNDPPAVSSFLEPVSVELGSGPHRDAADLLTPLLYDERLSRPVTHQEPNTVILHDATDLRESII